MGLSWKLILRQTRDDGILLSHRRTIFSLQNIETLQVRLSETSGRAGGLGWRTARSGCLVPAAPSAQVPQGRLESSPALQRWGKRPLGIESRRDDRATQLRRRRFCRPSGTRSAFLLYPALKRWATFESSLAGLPKAIPELSNWGSPPAKPGDFHSIKKYRSCGESGVGGGPEGREEISRWRQPPVLAAR